MSILYFKMKFFPSPNTQSRILDRASPFYILLMTGWGNAGGAREEAEAEAPDEGTVV